MHGESKKKYTARRERKRERERASVSEREKKIVSRGCSRFERLGGEEKVAFALSLFLYLFLALDIYLRCVHAVKSPDVLDHTLKLIAFFIRQN